MFIRFYMHTESRERASVGGDLNVKGRNQNDDQRDLLSSSKTSQRLRVIHVNRQGRSQNQLNALACLRFL